MCEVGAGCAEQRSSYNVDPVIMLMCVCSGPVVVLRLELGVLSRGNLGPVEVVAEYIRLNQPKQVNDK